MSQTIKVEFDPDQPMPGRHVGSDEEGPVYEPMTLLDAVVERAAVVAVERLEKTGKKLMSDALDERLAALLDERLPAMVDEALNSETVVTSPFGSEVWRGSLRERLIEYAREQLKVKEDRYGNDRTVIAQVLKDTVDHALHRDLAAAVSEAKSELLERLREAASSVLEQSVAEAMRARVKI